MIQLTKATIENYAARYDAQASEGDRTVERKVKELLKTQRYLTKSEFIEVGLWKSDRPKKWFEANEEDAVREITTCSFSAKTEQARLGTLFAIRGVSFPVASVILHFAFPERYPILDFRAIWSLGWEQPANYTVAFWERYCARIREIASEFQVPIRTVDKALWQYSKEHQPPRAAL